LSGWNNLALYGAWYLRDMVRVLDIWEEVSFYVASLGGLFSVPWTFSVPSILGTFGQKKILVPPENM